jgi:hypothetical protein
VLIDGSLNPICYALLYEDKGQGFEAAKMANGQTRGGPMRDLRKKKEALQIPLRPLPREASEGEAQINWEQALLGKQGRRTICKGQKSRTPPPPLA